MKNLTSFFHPHVVPNSVRYFLLQNTKENNLKNVLAAVFHVITTELNKSGQIVKQITQNDFCGQINCKNETEKLDTGPQNQL